MGYILELRAGSIDQLRGELTTPTLPVPNREPEWDGIAEVYARWGELQQFVAESIGAGREWIAEGSVALYISTVIQELTYWWNAVQYSSSGGEEFRSELETEVASLFGEALVGHLVRRPILGITTDDFPYFGWADTPELEAALGRAGPPPPLAQQGECVRAVGSSAAAAVERGVDLITLYA